MAGSFHPPLPNTSTDSIRRARRGLTLIEMLIAVVLTLIVVFALVRVFQMLGDNVRDTKAILEMSGQLRTFLSQLQEDLDSRTVTVRSYADPEAAPGYFELIEGIATDRDVDGDGQIPLDGDDNLLRRLLPVATIAQLEQQDRMILADADFHTVTDSKGNTWNAMTTKGDRDDVLMFTIRTSGKPFTGKVNGVTIESQEAEVVWWSQPDKDGNFHIYRRLLLVRPDIDPGLTAATQAQFALYIRNNDLSVRRRRQNDPPSASGSTLIANSLVDLTLRENRYAHVGQLEDDASKFPFPLSLERLHFINVPGTSPDPLYRLSPDQRSEYLSLADTLAFDVKVFDPTAPLQLVQLAGGALAVAPSDPGYDNDPQKRRQQWRGAYVDLSYANDQPNVVDNQSPPFRSEFSTVPARRSGWLNNINNKWDTSSIRGFYDTWPRSYERDGHAQQNGSYAPPGPNVVADRGTNGLDDDNQNGVDDSGQYGVDDSGEFETAPPYSADLRGIEVSVRVFEFNTRQVRQASIVADFTEGLGP